MAQSTLEKIDNMNREQVSFKVTLLQKSEDTIDSKFVNIIDKIEVRRFVIPKHHSKSVYYLKHKIISQFRNQLTMLGIDGAILQIHWKDKDAKDGDFVKVDSDSDLRIGLNENKEVLNLSVVAGPGHLVTNLQNAASLAHVH